MPTGPDYDAFFADALASGLHHYQEVLQAQGDPTPVVTVCTPAVWLRIDGDPRFECQPWADTSGQDLRAYRLAPDG